MERLVVLDLLAPLDLLTPYLAKPEGGVLLGMAMAGWLVVVVECVAAVMLLGMIVQTLCMFTCGNSAQKDMNFTGALFCRFLVLGVALALLAGCVAFLQFTVAGSRFL